MSTIHAISAFDIKIYRALQYHDAHGFALISPFHAQCRQLHTIGAAGAFRVAHFGLPNRPDTARKFPYRASSLSPPSHTSRRHEGFKDDKARPRPPAANIFQHGQLFSSRIFSASMGRYQQLLMLHACPMLKRDASSVAAFELRFTVIVPPREFH